jgi:putative phage-type endonuclease
MLGIPTKQERTQFLRDRQKGLGGSDMAGVAGLDPFTDPMQVYLSKVRDIGDEEDEPNIHMLRGVILEPVAALLYAEATGRDVASVGVKEHPSKPWARVNIDREIRAPDLPLGVLEIKAPGTRAMQHVIEFGAREQHIVQLQWGMFVTGCSWGSFAEINLEHEAGPLQHFDQEPNPLLIEQLEEVGETFWNDYVLERKPPHPTEWGRTPIEVPPHDAERVVFADMDVLLLVQNAMNMLALKKECEDEYDEHRRFLQDWMDHKRVTKIQVPGQGKVNYGWRDGKVTFDHKRLAEYGALDPDKVEKYLRKMAHALRTKLESFPDATGPVIQWSEALENEIVEGIPRLLAASELDLELFRKQGDAYRHFQPYPMKDREQITEGGEA